MRYLLTTILTFILLVSLNAQNSVSFSHLGNTTFQNTYLNPALIPEGKIFIGLPVLSGVHFNVNNKLSYNDAFSKEGGEVLLKISEKVLPNLQSQNLFSTQVNVNLLHVGYKLKSGMLLSFSANERIEADFVYSKELVDYLWRGNASTINQDVKVQNAGVNASHFREFALGVAAPINDHLTVGMKGKFLVGFGNISTPGNFNAILKSDGEAFQVDADWSNATMRTSGLDIYQGNEGSLGSHLIVNSNTGFAIDLGATYHLNKYYTVTASIIDAGFINWKENIKNESLNDTTFRYDGVPLDDISDVRQIVEDSLLSRFETTANSDAYRSWLPVRAYGSWIYHYSKKTDIHVTVGTRLIQRQLKMMYGGGVTHKFGKVFTASVSATKLPQQFFNAGAAFAVQGGPVQIYMAADQIISFSAPDMKALDFRVGMNFKFGQREKEEQSGFSTRPPIAGARGIDTNAFLGAKVKTKKRDGIYSIIKRQKRRELKSKKTERNNKVQKKSLNGRTGKKNASQD